MRRHDVFGKKITQIRPFYLLILVFIIILPSHFILDFYQQSKVNELETERIKLELEINSLLLEHQNEVIDDVTIGQIYSGFEHYYFNYYLEQDINLYLDLAGLSLVESKLINISDVTTSPFTENISTEVAYKKVDLEFVTDEQDKLFDFITILLGQDQLFYVENLESNLLEDDSLRINMTIYTFYLKETEWENIGKDLKEIVGKIKTIFVDEKRDFFKIATKALAAFLFYIGLMLPFYSGRVFGVNVRVSMFIMDICFIYFFGILGFILTYLYFAFKSKDKEANKVYKIQTIVIIVMYLRFLLSYILDSSDSLVTTKIGLGFFLTTIALALLILLTWKEDLVLNFVYKFLKLPEKNKLEEVNSEIKEENEDGIEVEMNAEEKV